MCWFLKLCRLLCNLPDLRRVGEDAFFSAEVTQPDGSAGICIRGFGQSNSLPTAGSVGGGMGRRNPRQYQIPSRNVPSARLGLLGTSGFVSSNQRNTTAAPTIMKQGRQVCSAPGKEDGSQAQGLRLQTSPQVTPGWGERPRGTMLGAVAAISHR
ncbi:hypothetical protein P7K49_018085 [Saguinus oedipus]|uniref:Uncharacterized protein n=1 Tax=Saguinus oedipus TaxID=9490 RepID=A0ABQ9V5H2_SAGOE|nr:hypothetical protein P7K49_018085 [Saguinus oedipus]